MSADCSHDDGRVSFVTSKIQVRTQLMKRFYHLNATKTGGGPTRSCACGIRFVHISPELVQRAQRFYMPCPGGSGASRVTMLVWVIEVGTQLIQHFHRVLVVLPTGGVHRGAAKTVSGVGVRTQTPEHRHDRVSTLEACHVEKGFTWGKS